MTVTASVTAYLNDESESNGLEFSMIKISSLSAVSDIFLLIRTVSFVLFHCLPKLCNRIVYFNDENPGNTAGGLLHRKWEYVPFYQLIMLIVIFFASFFFSILVLFQYIFFFNAFSFLLQHCLLH